MNIKRDFSNFDHSFIQFFDVRVQDEDTTIKELLTTELTSSLDFSLEKLFKSHNECVAHNSDNLSQLNDEI